MKFNINTFLNTFKTTFSYRENHNPKGLQEIKLHILLLQKTHLKKNINPDSVMEICNEVEKHKITGFRNCRKVLEFVPFKSSEFRNEVIFDWNRISIADSGLKLNSKKHGKFTSFLVGIAHRG